MNVEAIGAQIVDAAVKVHRALGPGLLESAYHACLAHELRRRGLKVDTEVTVPVHYEGLQVDAGYRIDLLVERTVIIETKAVEQLQPIHHAQVLTYLRLSGLSLAYLINFHELRVADGLKRIVLNHPSRPLAPGAGPGVPWAPSR